MQKIKNVLQGKEEERRDTTTATPGTTPKGVEAMPTSATGAEYMQTSGTTAGSGEKISGEEYQTRVEDVPVVKERVERVVEHRPYETEFVTETRPTGQVKKGDVSYVETGATTERIVSEAQPKPPSEK